MTYEEKILAQADMLRDELKTILVGMKMESSQCNCGCIKLEGGYVCDVLPDSMEIDNIVAPYLWNATIECDDGKKYSASLGFFIDEQITNDLFTKYFYDLVAEGRIREWSRLSYMM